MKSFLIIILCFLFNCASLANTYDVYIDSNFSNDERMIVEESLHHWELATHYNVNFNIYYDHARTNNHSINIMVSSKSFINTIAGCDDPTTGGCTDRNSITDSSMVYLPMDFASTKRYLQPTMEHEIGHAIGLHHSNNGIMRAHLGEINASITCDDVYNYYELRNIKELCY